MDLFELVPFPKRSRKAEKLDKKLKKQNKKPKRNQTSDALPPKLVNIRCKKAALNMDWNPTERKTAFMLLIMANTGLRYSDVSELTHHQIKNRVHKFKTEKTGVNNKVYFNDTIWNAYQAIYGERSRQKGHLFKNKLGNFIQDKAVNTFAKKLFVDYLSRGLRISTQSMRKTFADNFIMCKGNNLTAVKNLQRVLGHVNINNTLKYLNRRDIYTREPSFTGLFKLKKH